MILILRNSADLKRLDEEITKTQWPILVEVSHAEEIRSMAQNRLMWAWFGEIAEHLVKSGVNNLEVGGEQIFTSKAAVHGAFKDSILVPRYGVDSTTKLSAKQFQAYLEDIEEFAAERLWLRLQSDPDVYETVFPEDPVDQDSPSMGFERQPFWRSSPYLEWVRSLACANCASPPPNEPHHMIGIRGGVMGEKTHDYEAVPLCRRCHDELHRMTDLICRQQRWVRRTVESAIQKGVLST